MKKKLLVTEKYESLSLAALRDIAKARKLKGVSTMKKSELIELMLEQDEKDKAKEVLAVNHAAYSERISVLVGNYLRTL